MKRIRISLGAVLLTALSSVPVVADDIEIYQSENQGSSAVQPNILFILDTSGSMDSAITTQVAFEPLTDYSALVACTQFDSNKVYFLPPGDSLSDVTCSNTYSANSFNKIQNKCGSLNYALFGVPNATVTPELHEIHLDINGDVPLDNNGDEVRVLKGLGGYKQDRYTQWTGAPKKTWSVPKINQTADAEYLECLTDDGVHGIDAASTAKWIAPGTGSEYASVDTTVAWTDDISLNAMFYSGNYANYLVYAATNTASIKKIDIMRDTIVTIMDGGVSNVDVGIMKFNDGSTTGDSNLGGTVMHPILDIKLPRNDLFATMKTWNAESGTPLTEVVYEGMRYFAGVKPHFGGIAGDPTEGSTTLTVDGEKYYKSPVDADSAECERQFMILLSDGDPHGDTDSNALVQGLTDFVGTDGGSTCDGNGSSGHSSYIVGDYNNGRCLDDLTKHLHKKGVTATLNDGKFQTGDTANVLISTYTVGLAIDSELIKAAGEEGTGGTGGYKVANSASDLLKTLVDLIEDIKQVDTTFASPAVSVNAFNRTTHRNDLYFTLFKPASSPHWDGNFKRFKLIFDTAGVPSIVDANDNNAIDPLTGFFVDTSESFWTSGADLPDGSQTEKGGAASKLTNTRNVYSNLDTSVSLTAAANIVEETNPELTDVIMGGVTGTAKTDLIKWLRGIDTNDSDGDGDSLEARRVMGDPLHAQPALIEYKDGATADPYIVAYVATNDGYLHAFDTRTTITEPAKEVFSFIPKDLLQNMNNVYDNTATGKQYGLDGTVSSWINDVNKDGIINAIDDQVIIFFGMRRGGNDYYALDVTVPTAPKFLWKIEGGVDNGLLGDYTELSQTWSTPQVRKIRLNGADKLVLIFAAGYDTAKDDISVAVRTADTIGRGIFIVDAMNGKRLWHMGPTIGAELQNTDMVYSMPSDVAAADAAGDGYVDHLYIGDMGGQLWRIDINNELGETESNISNIITGGRIADLSDSSVASDRRFYYPPDVAILKDALDQSYLSVLITSGNRSHPITRTVQDRVYMIRDLPVFGKPTTYTTITSNDSTEELFDTTENVIGQGTDIDRAGALSSLQSSNGWYINFDAAIGEKGLTKPLIFLGEAFFATYVPTDPSVISKTCSPAQGTGFLYHINLENGTPVKNYDELVSSDPEALTKEDRKKTLTRSGIPADPTLVIPSDGAAVCVGTECDKAEGVLDHQRVYWFEE